MANNEKSKHPSYTADAILSDINESYFLGNPVLDNLVTCMINVSAELWSTKRRMKVMEAVMTKHGVTPDMLEQYVPTETETSAWKADRDRFIALTLGPLGNDGIRNISADFPKRG